MAPTSSKLTAYALVAIVGLSAFPVAAQEGFSIYVGPGGPRYDDRYDRYDRDGYYHRPPPRRQGCSPRQAMQKASRYLRNTWIISYSRQYVDVGGIGKRGENNHVVLFNRPDCSRADGE